MIRFFFKWVKNICYNGKILKHYKPYSERCECTTRRKIKGKEKKAVYLYQNQQLLRATNNGESYFNKIK